MKENIINIKIGCSEYPETQLNLFVREENKIEVCKALSVFIYSKYKKFLITRKQALSMIKEFKNKLNILDEEVNILEREIDYYYDDQKMKNIHSFAAYVERGIKLENTL